ncbi:HAD superfamily hydrolase (TIGR01484 family) [Arcanobacterium pluranimalium]|uniref:HAD family hydrolase n=1 Tax=Arcanobacterium pluranimalium TaxID=108028 RepID=UPI003084143D|nr:HAD superfamily hydrolase (TIGR01484 family) [Arcanobacterium pluranimalium]
MTAPRSDSSGGLPPRTAPNTAWREAILAAELPSAGPQLMVALDIDGTILHHDTSLSPRVKEAIAAHLAAGTNLVIATGRGISGAQVAMQQFDFCRGYAVCSNGSIVLSVGGIAPQERTTPVADVVKEATPEVAIVASNTFDPQREIEIISKALPDAVMAVETLDQARKITGEFPPGELTGQSVIVPLAQLSDPHATRLTVRAPHLTALELLDVMDDLGLHGMEYAVGWSAWMDIAPVGISKATSLEYVRNILGVDPRHTVAVGDSGNDCEMLTWAGLGVAMGNAPEYVAAYADTITADVYADGCALVLEELLG